MFKVLILALAITASVCTELRGNQDQIFKAFNEFIVKYEKTYNSQAEFNARLAIFTKNFNRLHNYKGTRKSTHSVGVTKFFDMSPQEFKNTYLNLKTSVLSQVLSEATVVNVEKEPLQASVDWRTKGAVYAVKDQGQCGSCWAFSTAANIEGQNFIKHKTLIPLAEQQLVDCDHNGDQGCNGGLMENAFAYLKSAGGIMGQADYKYTAREGTCRFKKTSVKVVVTGFVKPSSDDETALATFLGKTGPLAVALNAEPLQYYDGGIFNPDESECDPQGIDHAVTMVGYGSENGQDFWIVKNSWGASWGEQGYFRIARGTGACGINTMASSATIQ